MVCTKVRGDSICKTKTGRNRYTVSHTRPGRYGGTFIFLVKERLTGAQATKLKNKIIREIKSTKIKPRRTPYP